MSNPTDMQIPEISNYLDARVWGKPSKDVINHAIYFDEPQNYDKMFCEILLKNQLCVIGQKATSSWKSRNLWVTAEGKPNFAYIKDHFGEAFGPVANCNKEEFHSHHKEEMKVKDFIEYWEDFAKSDYSSEKQCLYLKDWHFTRYIIFNL